MSEGNAAGYFRFQRVPVGVSSRMTPLALADQPLDLGDRHVGARVLDAPQRDDTEHQPGSHYGYRCIDNLPSTNC